MPVATIHLISLASPSQLPALLGHIKSSNVTPFVTSKPIRWIIRPERINPSELLEPRWDLLVIFEESQASRDLVRSIESGSSSFRVEKHWSTRTAIPTRLTKDFLAQTNPSLLYPDPASVPALTGALNAPILKESSQDLSFSPDLRTWIGNSESSLPVKGAVSMLNLLSFKPEMKSSYMKYGKAFAETIGSKRGGNAKLVGNLIDTKDQPGQWHEFALAHYPSLLHFADMLASKDYQAVNQEHRVGALADTCILCTSELELAAVGNEGKAGKAKL